MSPRPPSLLRNPISLLGMLIGAASTAFGLPMMVIDMFSRQTHAYLAVIIYLVLPFVAGGGVALILLGAWWERRRRSKRPGLAVPSLPTIALNRTSQQLAVMVALTIVVVIVVL